MADTTETAAKTEKTTSVHIVRDIWDANGVRQSRVANSAGDVPDGAPTWECPQSMLKSLVNNGSVRIA